MSDTPGISCGEKFTAEEWKRHQLYIKQMQENCAGVSLPASAATLSLRLMGDIGGNSQMGLIEVDSDGGQFPDTRIHKSDEGFALAIIGTWELQEFIEGLTKAAKKLGVIDQ